MIIELIQKGKKRHTFFKFCKNCNKRFSPDGRTSKLCNKCLIKSRKWNK